ncbi:hypothetical protein [Cohnella sp. WQ 127256]|uniref:hypothetical protein n=1 Tax=Cohnella sp. WQ 127256 TaxID=2938790 RepID=UPI002117F81C|nr:hypothetical protein [Cohnella sp. WQ 127256]
MRIVMYILLLVCFITTGCTSTKTIGNPTASEVLKMEPNANVFMYKDTIYNAGIPWVDELELTKDIQETEITRQSNKGRAFKNGTANKLGVGTKVFRVKERNDMLIAETEGGDIRFYQLVEG